MVIPKTELEKIMKNCAREIKRCKGQRDFISEMGKQIDVENKLVYEKYRTFFDTAFKTVYWSLGLNIYRLLEDDGKYTALHHSKKYLTDVQVCKVKEMIETCPGIDLDGFKKLRDKFSSHVDFDTRVKGRNVKEIKEHGLKRMTKMLELAENVWSYILEGLGLEEEEIKSEFALPVDVKGSTDRLFQDLAKK